MDGESEDEHEYDGEEEEEGESSPKCLFTIAYTAAYGTLSRCSGALQEMTMMTMRRKMTTRWSGLVIMTGCCPVNQQSAHRRYGSQRTGGGW